MCSKELRAGICPVGSVGEGSDRLDTEDSDICENLRVSTSSGTEGIRSGDTFRDSSASESSLLLAGDGIESKGDPLDRGTTLLFLFSPFEYKNRSICSVRMAEGAGNSLRTMRGNRAGAIRL